MRKKLTSQRGETLIETLVSLLVAVLSVGILTSAMTVSARINKSNREADKKYAQELQNAEGLLVSNSAVQVELHFEHETTSAGAILYGGDGSFVSYLPQPKVVGEP